MTGLLSCIDHMYTVHASAHMVMDMYTSHHRVRFASATWAMVRLLSTPGEPPLDASAIISNASEETVAAACALFGVSIYIAPSGAERPRAHTRIAPQLKRAFGGRGVKELASRSCGKRPSPS